MPESVDVIQLERILHSPLLEKAEALLLEKLASGKEVFFEKLGNIYRQQGKLAQAAETYDRWAEAFPQSQKAKYLADLFNQRPLSVHWPEKGFTPTPFQVREDFLPTEFHHDFIRFAIDSRAYFKPSRLLTDLGGEWKSLHNPELLNCTQINLPTKLEKRFLAELAEFLPSIGKQDYIERCNSAAPFLLRYGDGNFFAAHIDDYQTGTPGITLVYYFSIPEGGFSGGDNVFYDTDPEENTCDCNSFTLMPFADNRLVVFPGNHYHGVLPVHLADDRFECGRFALGTFLPS